MHRQMLIFRKHFLVLWLLPATGQDHATSASQHYCADDQLDRWAVELRQREESFQRQARRERQQIQEKMRMLKIKEVWYKSMATTPFAVDRERLDSFTPHLEMVQGQVKLRYPFTLDYEEDPFFNNTDPGVNTCPFRCEGCGVKGYRDADVLTNLDPDEVSNCRLAPTPNRLFHTVMNHCHTNAKRGQCTEWADGRYFQLTGIHVPFIDHAGNWSKYAPYEGWVVSKTPIVPSIVVLTPRPEDTASPGHVSVVENIYDDGFICTSHWNAPRPRLLTVRQERIRPEYSFVYHPDGMANYLGALASWY